MKSNNLRQKEHMRLTAAAIFLAILNAIPGFAQKVSVSSPNQKIIVSLHSQQNSDTGEWYLRASYNSNGKIVEAIPRSAVDVLLLRRGGFAASVVPYRGFTLVK